MVKSFFTTLEDGNIAYHVTDDKNSVDKARENLALKYHFDKEKLCYMEQIHSNIVKVVEPNQTFYPSCDALISNIPKTPLMVMVADCIPILFFDPVQEVVGVAHAGRAGTFENISKNVVGKMKEHFSSQPKDMRVSLGASIQKCCYEVSKELADFVKENFGEEFCQERNINLQAINKMQLINEGVLAENITISPICTKCSNQPYFSYRKEQSCGRFAGIIFLQK